MVKENKFRIVNLSDQTLQTTKSLQMTLISILWLSADKNRALLLTTRLQLLLLSHQGRKLYGIFGWFCVELLLLQPDEVGTYDGQT